jgi:quercetin dioxygenase-like cupin family protein
MEIERHPKTENGPADAFSGDAWVTPIAVGRGPSQVAVTLVHFSPGARTAWHSHPRGQTLFIIEGAGLVQTRGEATVKVRAGDVIYTPPDEVHWHGATPTNLMSHLSITERINDSAWSVPPGLRHVSDAEYSGETVQ